MSSQTQLHPEVDKLRAFGLGILDASDAARVERHIVECPECCQTLLALGEDTFIDLVRRSEQAGGSPRSAEATIDSLIEPRAEPTELPAALAQHPRYRIVRLIGRGGMGDVYQAEHKLMNRPVAIKVIRRRLVASTAAVERFHREVQAAARLSHPNIVTAHDAEQAGDLHFLVMEYVEGTDLAEVVRQRGPLPADQACDYIRQAAAGLQHAHEQGMVHRDIKPHNLMLTAGGKIKILDFGLANFASSSAAEQSSAAAAPGDVDAAASQLTTLGTTMGTPDYIAPEQAEDAHAADIRADLYSLGCTLYFLLAGKPPFSEGDVMHKLAAHRSQTPEPIESVRVDVPQELAKVLRRLLAKSPTERFQTPAEVADALAPFVDRQRSFPPREAKPVAASASRSGTRFGILALGAAAAVFLGATLAVVYYIASDAGTLRIESHADNVTIEIVGASGIVKVVDLDTGAEVQRLPSGEYSLRIKEGPASVRLDKQGFILKRGKTVVVKAEFVDGMQPPARGGLTELVRFEGHESYVLKLDFAPLGSRLVTACGRPDSRVLLWDARNGRLQREYKSGSRSLHTVTFSPDGRYVASAGKSGEIILLDATELKEVRRWKAHDGFIDCLAFSPDSRRLASGSDNWSGPAADVSARVWDVETGRLVWKQDMPQSDRRRAGKGRGGQVFGLAYSPDGQYLMTAHQSPAEQVTIWQADSGKRVRTFGKTASMVRCATWSPDGRLIATGHTALNMVGNRWADREHCVIRLYDPTTGSEVRTLTGHTGPLESLDFSPDGKLLVSSSGGQYLNDDFYERNSSDNSIRIWDVASGRELLKHDMPQAVKCVRFSIDGKTIASAAGAVGDKADVRLWRLPENLGQEPREQAATIAEIRRLVGHKDNIEALAYSRDGKYLFAGDGDRLLQQWDVQAGRIVRKFPVGDFPWGIAVHPDGQHVISSQFGGSITMWSLESGRAVRRFSGHTRAVMELAISPDGKRLLSGGHDGLVRLWDVETGEPIHSFQESYCNAVALTSDGRLAAHGGTGSGLHIWETETGETLHEIGRGAAAVSAAAFSPDGTVLVTGDGYGLIQVWDVRTGKEIHHLDAHTSYVTSLAFVPGGRFFVSGSYDKTMRLFDLVQGMEIAHVKSATLCVSHLAISPDGRTLASGGGKRVQKVDGQWQPVKDGDYDIRLWRLPESVQRQDSEVPLITTAERLFTGPDSNGFSIAVSKDGSQALVGHYGKGVSLWDVSSGRRIRQFTGTQKAVHSVHFWPDGKHAVAASEDGTIRLWELESGREVRRFEGHAGRIDCLALSRDGSLLLSGSADYGQDRDHSVRLWDAASGQELRKFGEAARYIRDLVFSSDASRAYGAGVGLTSVVEWDVNTGAPVHRFEDCPTAPISLAVSPDGKLLATGHFARRREKNRWNDPDHAIVRLWDLESRKIVRELRGHAGPVGDVAFTRDGQFLLSLATGEHDAGSNFIESSDQTVRLWEVETGREVARYELQERVIQLAVLPDGKSFLTVGDSIRLWRLPESAWPEQAITEVEPIDLLGDIDPAKHVTAAPWEPGIVDGFTFRKGKTKYSSLVPDVPVTGNYDLHIELTRTKGDQPAITFPVGDSACTLVLGRVQDQVGGLEIIENRTVSTPGNPATFRSPLLDDQRYTITIQVRLQGEDEAEIVCQYDGKPLVQWRGDPSSLSVSKHWQLPRSGRVGLGAWCERGTVTYHRAELRLGSQPNRE